MANKLLTDAQYRNGYQVLEGGDYLVHSVGTKFKGKHIVIRTADGVTMGAYLSRNAANRRAQELGGNSAKSRRLRYMQKPVESFTWLGLNKQERSFAETTMLSQLSRQVEMQFIRTASKSARNLWPRDLLQTRPLPSTN